MKAALFSTSTNLWLALRRVDRTKYQIQIPLPPKIDPTVTMMTVEEKPDVTYSDIGGCKEQIEKMREVVELPMLHPEKFVQLGIDPPKGVLCFGPPGCLGLSWPADLQDGTEHFKGFLGLHRRSALLLLFAVGTTEYHACFALDSNVKCWSCTRCV